MIVCVVEIIVFDAFRTRARTWMLFPAKLLTYFTQASASPGCGKIVSEPVLHGAWVLVSPGLVTDTPGTGVGKVNSTGTPSGTGFPNVSVTRALITVVNVPSPLLFGTGRGTLMAICCASGAPTLRATLTLCPILSVTVSVNDPS